MQNEFLNIEIMKTNLTSKGFHFSKSISKFEKQNPDISASYIDLPPIIKNKKPVLILKIKIKHVWC